MVFGVFVAGLFFTYLLSLGQALETTRRSSATISSLTVGAEATEKLLSPKDRFNANMQIAQLELKSEEQADQLKWQPAATVGRAAAISGPIFAGIAALIVGILTQRQQARENLKLKIIETILDTANPHRAFAKAQMLRTVFPDTIGNDALKELDTDNFEREHGMGKKEDLIQILAETGKATDQVEERRAHILRTWNSVFKRDREWIKLLAEHYGVSLPDEQNDVAESQQPSRSI